MPNQHTTRKQAEAQTRTRRTEPARRRPSRAKTPPDAGERMDALERRLAASLDDAVRTIEQAAVQATQATRARFSGTAAEDEAAKRAGPSHDAMAAAPSGYVGAGPIGSHMDTLDAEIDQLADAIHDLADAIAPILAPEEGVELLDTPQSGIPLHDRMAAATTRISNLTAFVRHVRGRVAL